MPPKGSVKRKRESGTPTAVKKANLSINSSSSSGGSHRLVEKIRTVSQPEMVDLSYEYTIADVSLLPQNPGDFVSSPCFHAKMHPSIKWHLQIYPYGNNEESRGYLSIYLYCTNLKQEEKAVPVVAHFKFTVFKNGEKLGSAISKKPRPFTDTERNWGFKKCLGLNQPQSKNQSGDDQLKVVCFLMFEAKRNWLTNLDRTSEDVASSSLDNQQQVMELKYDWTIEEPAFLPQKNGESFYSPIFSAKLNDKIRWRLKMCPKGANEESKDHFSLYLEQFTDKYEKSVIFKSNWLVTKNGKVIFSKSNELQTLRNAPLPSNFGWDKVAPLASIERASFDTFPGIDELKVSCQLVYTI